MAGCLLVSLTKLSAQVRLTEILATNSGGLKDQAGVPRPWIELWNPSQAGPVNLANYRLVHGASTWLFPAVHIMADERMIIFASGMDLKEVTAPLHTNFVLSESGGTLTLQNSSGSTISRFDYPALLPDISWGRDEWDTATNPVQTGVYAHPTPGERANYDEAGVAGHVVIDPPPGAFTGTLSVTLSLATPDPGAIIRYTTNRTVPTAASTPYTGPISITSTQMIRARVFRQGLLPGETETAAWLQLNATTQSFSSAIPICVLTSFTTTAPPDDGDQAAYLWVWEAGADGRARFTDSPAVASRTVIDKRGSSTLGNPKFNLNVELRKNRDDDERDVALLGMAAHSDWVFGAPYNYDRSLIHNPLMSAISRSMGRYACDSRMAEVFIDVTGSTLNFTGTASGTSDYFGVYNIMEKVRRGSARVDINRLNTYDNGEQTKTGGYIWKVDRIDPGDTGFTAGGQLLAYYYPKEVDLESPQRAPQRQYLTNYLNGFNAALNSATWTDPVSGYAAWIDVPATIDNHLLNLWSYNVDAFRLSTYFYKDAGGKIFPGPIWDFDRALSSTDGRDANPVAWGNGNWPEGGFFAAIWWERFFKDIDFYQKYIDRWQDLRRGQFSPAVVNARIDAMNSAIGTEAVARDLARWNNSKRAWTSPFTGTAYSGQPAEIQRIKDYLQQRANYFDTQWVGPVNASPSEGAVAANTTVTLTGPAGVPVYYTLNGQDPRPSGGGAPIASAVLWNGTPIPVSGFTRILARAWKSGHTGATGGTLNPPLLSKWSGLRDLKYFTDDAAAAGNLVITEINFNPLDPSPEELAAGPGWTNNSFEFLELRNTGPRRVDLTGVRFTSGISYDFPSDGAAFVEPGAYIIVASDPAALVARYGSAARVFGPWSGNLSNGGETITLLAANDSVIQSLTYDDTWFPEADKGGATLVIFDALASPATINTQGNWRASAATGGSPGGSDPAGLQPGPEGDVISVLYHPETSSITLTFHSVPNGNYSVMTSPDLHAWTTARSDLPAGGNATVFEYTPAAGLTRFFMKVIPESPSGG